MKQFDLVIIGFGKAGKTLAKTAARQGKKVAVIEQSNKMYGGTCINIGCIPSKVLVHDGELNKSFVDAFERKSEVVGALNKKNYNTLATDENIEVVDGKAKFKSNYEVEVFDDNDKLLDTYTSKNIVINTGASPVIPDIEGVKTSKRLYDSTGIMNLSEQPKRLVIIGGGYIALEFASMFNNLGTDVTVLERSDILMPKEDEEIRNAAINDLTEAGINFVTEAESEKFEDTEDHTIVHTNKGTFEADAVLLAIGRKPNVDLGLENTDIELTDRKEIKVDEHLRTTREGIYAVGDVKGGMQFTYISLDDFRIVKDDLYGDKERTTENRGAVPYTVFIDPPLSRVGMTAKEAKEASKEIKEGKLPVNSIPRHKINNDPRGLFKAVVDAETNEVLGATLYGKESEEMINIVKLAIDQKISYEVLRDNIYTHPTMTESLNDLFNVKE
ncbi:dihydrolipoamide dehydrogenase [Phocicoccus schoeneichii]|uniref:Mercuric reductase n=1 Tax=Phocicoccus schoeneichii TaxID=1812261 RepID=A0A6V7RI68_9BACL|nr:hypothiocyanous acid reductase MerA [Jeotgalicoccus schoeneichii]GGH47047.1 dihydrolipoamide dehydrogenase [Jeotgalicoccus schoeneichii]CAD2077763.1 Mercuric reductase [Jeotgalicoccus schoeneichii]